MNIQLHLSVKAQLIKLLHLTAVPLYASKKTVGKPMFRVREPTSSSVSKLLFLVFLSFLLSRCYCILHFTHRFYLPFKLSSLCILVPRALWRLSSLPRSHPTAHTQMKVAAATSGNLSPPDLRINTLSFFFQS